MDVLTPDYGDDAKLVATLTLWEYAKNDDPIALYNLPDQVNFIFWQLESISVLDV